MCGSEWGGGGEKTGTKKASTGDGLALEWRESGCLLHLLGWLLEWGNVDWQTNSHEEPRKGLRKMLSVRWEESDTVALLFHRCLKQAKIYAIDISKLDHL